eukprot:7078529-Prymnesium_polylepis.1
MTADLDGDVSCARTPEDPPNRLTAKAFRSTLPIDMSAPLPAPLNLPVVVRRGTSTLSSAPPLGSRSTSTPRARWTAICRARSPSTLPQSTRSTSRSQAVFARSISRM